MCVSTLTVSLKRKWTCTTSTHRKCMNGSHTTGGDWMKFLKQMPNGANGWERKENHIFWQILIAINSSRSTVPTEAVKSNTVKHSRTPDMAVPSRKRICTTIFRS